MIRNKSTNFSTLFISGIIWAILINYAYGSNYWLYTISSIVLLLVTIRLFFKHYPKMNRKLLMLVVILIYTSIFISLLHFNIVDAVFAGISLLIPLNISAMNIDYKSINKACIFSNIIMVVIFFLKQYLGILGFMNLNSLSMLGYLGFSTAFILIRQKGKIRILSIFIIMFALQAVNSWGSRNTLITILICTLLAILPKKFFTNKIFYRILYVLAMGYSIISTNVFLWILEKPIFMSWYLTITSGINKSWGIETRMAIIDGVRGVIFNQNLFSLFFGNGVQFANAHNGFYQTVYMYGIIGAIMIYSFYIVVFEMAYKIMLNNNLAEISNVIIGFVCIMVGNFLLQGAEANLFGVVNSTIVPFIVCGSIINIYYKEKQRPSPYNGVK